MVNSYCSQQLLASIPLPGSAIPRLPLGPLRPHGARRVLRVCPARLTCGGSDRPPHKG
jgi:hypothetical protein